MKFYTFQFSNISILLKKFKKIFKLNKITNFLINKIESYLLVKKQKSKPYYLIIEPTNKCNLNCDFCLLHKDVSKKVVYKFMNFELFKKILDSNKQALVIFFAGFGEPTLNKEIKKMIDYANKDFITFVSSNGTIIKDINPDFILFSLDYPTREKYFKHKRKDLFNVVIKNIEKFNKNKSKNTISFLQFMLKENEKINKKKYMILSRKTKCDYIIFKKIIEFDINKRLNQKKKHKYKPCKYIYNTNTYTVSGELKLCCDDLNNITIISNINSKKAILLRNKNRTHEILDICKECPKKYNNIFIKILKIKK